MDFTTGALDFPAKSGSGPQTIKIRHAFDRPVAQASAILTGYSASFVDADHNFGRLIVGLTHRIVNASTTGHEVEVFGTFGLRDLSGNWDDRYAGRIEYCLITVPVRQVPVVGPLHP